MYKSFSVCVCLVLILFSFPVVYAADQGDFYLTSSFGSAFRDNYRTQGTASLGYVPLDEVGFGLFYDELPKALQMGTEFRWFIEPAELSLGVGQLNDWTNGKSKKRPILTAGSNYLMGVNSWLALKAELKGTFAWGDKGRFYLGVGFRILFEKIY